MTLNTYIGSDKTEERQGAVECSLCHYLEHLVYLFFEGVVRLDGVIFQQASHSFFLVFASTYAHKLLLYVEIMSVNILCAQKALHPMGCICDIRERSV